MRDFFSLDGAFYKYGGLLADIMILSMLWLLCSLPIFTIGASTTALFYVTTRRIAEREGYISQDFWSAFKSNFKKATLIWFVMMIVIALLVFNFFNADIVGNMANIFFPVWIIFLVEITLVSVFIFPLAARFDMGIKQLFKSAFFMGNRHFFTSLSCVILAVAILFGVFMYPILIVVAMGLYAWLASYLIMRVFKKYRPEMDKDPLLELQELEAEMALKRREAEKESYKIEPREDETQ